MSQMIHYFAEFAEKPWITEKHKSLQHMSTDIFLADFQTALSHWLDKTRSMA